MNLKVLIPAIFFLFLSITTFSQIVTMSPADGGAGDEVEIVYDASEGTAGLKGATSVYMHSGVIMSGPGGMDWEYVIGNWGEDDGIGKMTKVASETDKWTIILSPSILEYYAVPDGTNVFRLAMVFRNADGSKEGKGTPGNFAGGTVAANGDIFIDLKVDNYVQLVEPANTTVFIESGTTVTFTANASSSATKLTLLIDSGEGFVEVAAEANVSSISYDYTTTQSVALKVKAEATFGTETTEETKEYSINLRAANTVAELPAGVRKGINYHADASKATLVLEAPGKEFVYVVGDFTDWQVQDAFLMNQTPGGELFWLDLSGLEAGKEYVFQYWVDGTIKAGDPYAEKVADPWNDQYIPETVYASLPAYSLTENGIASVLQTAQPAYSWLDTEDSWQRPAKENLIIYELLVRDFLGSHDYNDLADTLSYLKRLGVNAIELMPIMEFEGNESWGYNPTYFFAPDKYYGTKNNLKAFIEKAHQQGMAVILDMVLNHAFGQNPMVQMYWDATASKPSADNPWFNPDAKHPFNVGYDFNHESAYTQSFVDSVNHYWLSEYHFDGFRFDLSKGFTQKQTTDVGVWGQKDDSRIALLKRMASKIKAVDPDAYIILEHFAEPAEEAELIAEGMLVWGNSTHDYGDLAVGKHTASISAVKNEGRVSYMESHDEERLMYKTSNSGAGTSTYTVKDTEVGLERVKMLAAFFYTIPGPKMMWQFQELGYDVSINFNGRVGNKPLVWGDGSLHYYSEEERQKLYKTHAAIINLVRENRSVFSDGQFSWMVDGEVKSINIDHSDLDFTIVGNFALTEKNVSLTFTHMGIWYDYFSGESFEVSSSVKELQLQPGEFHIYSDRALATPEPGLVAAFPPIVTTDPAQFTAATEVTITFRADLAGGAGTAGLVGADKVYMVAGVVTDEPFGTTLTHIKGETGTAGEMTEVAPDTWTITFTPRGYFEVPEEERIYRIGVYFRNADGSALGKDTDGSILYLNLQSDAQIVTIEPKTFRPHQEIKIIFDAEAADPNGTAGLVGIDRVYMHAGIITDGPEATEWQYVVGNWGLDDGIGAMTKVTGEENKWEIDLKPREYFADVPVDVQWHRIGMVFRNIDGSREGKAEGGEDIFVNFGEVTSVPTEAFIGRFNIYPNPAQTSLTLSSHSEILLVQVLDMSGRKVALMSPEKISGSLWQISPLNLPKGLYIFHIISVAGSEAKRVMIE